MITKIPLVPMGTSVTAVTANNNGNLVYREEPRASVNYEHCRVSPGCTLKPHISQTLEAMFSRETLPLMFHVKHLYMGGYMGREKIDGDFIDIAGYEDAEYPFQLFVGGRGAGKTYSALRLGIEKNRENGEKFLWTRRTDKETEKLFDSKLRGDLMNPFKRLNECYKNEGWNYGIVKIDDGLGEIHNRERRSDGKWEYLGDPVGYVLSLVGIAGVRGINLEDCTRYFYDEFIKEKHRKAITGEGEAWLNACETIGRNREFDGGTPLFCYCFANAFEIRNVLFRELGVVDDCERMVNRGEHDKYYKSRGLGIHLLENTESFEEKKARTSLARLTKGTKFAEMAYDNSFAYDDFSLVGWRNIKGYRPICSAGDMYVWEKKGDGRLYITYTHGKCPSFDVETTHGRKAFYVYFQHDFKMLFIKGMIHFETYDIKQRILDLINIKS